MRQTSMAIRAMANFLYGPRESTGSWLVDQSGTQLHDPVATADKVIRQKPRQLCAWRGRPSLSIVSLLLLVVALVRLLA
jgi:hypothetical protein